MVPEGLGAWGRAGMPLRDFRTRPKSARTHYFLSHARGDAIRTVALRPIVVWLLVALAPISLVWGGGATLYLVFHDDMLGVLAARQAEMQYAYEDRLAEARGELDRLAGRQLLDQNSLEGKVHELLSRQAQLEQRGSIVAALLDETARGAAGPNRGRVAGAPTSALSAIGAASPLPPAAQAFAPIEPASATPTTAPKPRPVEEPREHVSLIPKSGSEGESSAELAAAADNPALGPSARLSLIGYALDRTERRQATALREIDATARQDAERLQSVVAKTGLAADSLAAPSPKGGVGGPFIPVNVDAGAPAFDKALASAARDVAVADRLGRLMPFLPVRAPLVGEAEVSSPFGYRPDPFLGRPALHPGVDLVQEYGAEIHATAGGRVVHAGPTGGYGNMVEIDHGNGLATRYGHMSEILVEEGQEVKAGAALGRIGTTGRSTGPHLHYEVRIDGEPVDPERFLQAGAPLFASQ
jgi:murein DD-endopeptidase MepM/ murein hydrolase activator NlpD